MTKSRTPTPVYLDPGMHPGLEVKGLMISMSENQQDWGGVLTLSFLQHTELQTMRVLGFLLHFIMIGRVTMSYHLQKNGL